MLQVGGRIGSYEVWGRVGGGGMSDVWLGRHSKQRSVVTLAKVDQAALRLVSARVGAACDPEER